MTENKYILPESELPKTWYNVVPDLPAPLPPPLHPGTLKPAGPGDLEAIFPPQLIEQEVSASPTIPIPEPVLDILRLWRPTPLCRARPAREGARNSSENLLQERRCLTGRKP